MPLAETQDWVFIRGLGRESAHWRPFLELFHKEFPQIRTHCLDLPGTGTRYKEESPLTLNQISAKAREPWLSGPHAHAPIVLVGFSLGGMVAMDWALRFPKNCRGMVVINTSLGSLSPVYRRLRPRAFNIPLRTFKGSRIERQEKLAMAIVSNQTTPQDEALKEWISIQTKHPVSRKTLLRQLVAAASSMPSWETLPFPGCVLVSEKDRMVDPRCSEDLAQKAQWPIYRHEWAGHDLAFDDPQWVIAKLSHWLATPSKS